MDSNALIESVKLYPSLYSKQQSGTSIEQKNSIWKEISLKINQPTEKCKAKWRNLRDSYQKSVKYRQELETIGKMSIYHEYKHEAALSFLEVGTKRKVNDGEKRSKPVKKQKEEFFETSYSETQDYSPAVDAVEYLIETDPDNNESRIENHDEEQDEEQAELIFQETSIDDEHQSQEITHDQIDNDISSIKNEEQIAQSVFAYETTPDNKIESTPQEEILYQESFVTETQPSVPSELDSWLISLKHTLLSFPKLMRARAKKQVNDVVSEMEINFLESLEIDRSQIN